MNNETAYAMLGRVLTCEDLCWNEPPALLLHLKALAAFETKTADAVALLERILTCDEVSGWSGSEASPLYDELWREMYG